MISIIVAVLFIINGFLWVFYPELCVKRKLLTEQQIKRNKKILRRYGIGILLIGIALLIGDLFWP